MENLVSVFKDVYFFYDIGDKVIGCEQGGIYYWGVVKGLKRIEKRFEVVVEESG